MAAPKEYPDELKAGTVRLYRKSDPKPAVREPVQQLGAHHEALRSRIRQADLKTELIYRRIGRTREETENALFAYIDG